MKTKHQSLHNPQIPLLSMLSMISHTHFAYQSYTAALVLLLLLERDRNVALQQDRENSVHHHVGLLNSSGYCSVV